MKLIFATNNQHKVKEVEKVLPPSIKVVSLKEAGIDIDIPEPHQTLTENAAEKAQTIYQLTQTNCFSEDTGLEVTALNGEPGVHSARYAGPDASSEKNIQKLLARLQPHKERRAAFKTVVFLILKWSAAYLEGICTGKITQEPKGAGGFGYDSVFIPDGTDKTFGEMSLEEKNRYSHRKRQLINW